ncbi:unnamed protein product [Alopecurus aequalis]
MAARRPKGTGRKKIEIQLIENKEARAICFSKRRRGLFNKAREVSTLCGAEVASIVFSPWGKAFSFGSPSVDSVLDRFCTFISSGAQAAEAVDGGDGNRNLAQAELNRELDEMRAQLAAIKAQKKAKEEDFAKARAEGSQAAAWLEPDVDVSQMAEEDLAAIAAALEKVSAAARASQLLQEGLLFGRPVHGGGGGEFELGGTSARGGMEMTQWQQMMMPPPTGFDAEMEMMLQQLMMPITPLPTGFAAGMETMQQQQMMMAMPPPPPPPPTGFAALRETMHQPQMMMSMPPPQTGFTAGMDTMQQPMMMAMPAPPTWFATGRETMQQQTMMGFATGMETQHQGSGHGFP